MVDAETQTEAQPADAAEADVVERVAGNDQADWQKKLSRGFTSEFPVRTQRPAPSEDVSLLRKLWGVGGSIWGAIKAFALHMSPRIQLGVGVNVFRFFQ